MRTKNLSFCGRSSILSANKFAFLLLCNNVSESLLNLIKKLKSRDFHMPPPPPGGGATLEQSPLATCGSLVMEAND